MCPKELPVIGAIISLLLLAACSTATAADGVTAASTQTLAAVQMDQYQRDAAATQSANDATETAQAYYFASTQSSFAQTQSAVDQHAVWQATQAVVTQAAIETVAARDATRQAGQDADATATARAEARAHLEGTQAARQQATATAQVVETQTAITLTTAQADAQRQQVANWAAGVLVVILALVGLWVLVSLVDVVARRLSLARYGPNGNPLIIMPGGAIYDPLKGITSGDELPAELRAQLALMGQQVLAIQAQHSPHPPVKPEAATKRSLILGPISTSTERTPVTVERPPAPALPDVPPAKQVETKQLWAIDKTGNSSLEDRNLQDVEDWIRIGWAKRDFSRAAWVGTTMPGTGRRISKSYWQDTMKLFEQVGIVACDGNGEAHPAVSLDEALDAFGLYTPRLVDPVTTRPDARQIESPSRGT